MKKELQVEIKTSEKEIEYERAQSESKHRVKID